MTPAWLSQPIPQAGPGPALSVHWLTAAIMSIIAATAFWDVLDYPHTAADAYAILQAAAIDAPADLLRVLTSEYRGGIVDSAALPYFRPLTLLTFTANHLIGGNDPGIYHATNIVLHGLGAMGVFWLARRALALPFAVAVGASALFVLHPIALEVVPAVARRCEPLLVIGLSLALVGARHRLEGRHWWLMALGTLVTVTAVERGLFIAGLMPVFFFLFMPSAQNLIGRAWNALVVSAPAWLTAIGFYVVRLVVVGGDSGLDLNLRSMLLTPAQLVWRTVHPQEFAGAVSVPDNPVGAALLGVILLVGGAAFVWMLLRSRYLKIHLFIGFALLAYAGLIGLASHHLPFYPYVMASFFSVSVATLVYEGVHRVRTDKGVIGALQAVAGVILAISVAYPSHLFHSYPAWDHATSLSTYFSNSLNDVSRHHTDDTHLIIVNAPWLVMEDDDRYLTRRAIVFWPYTVPGLARFNQIPQPIVALGGSEHRGEFRVPSVTFDACRSVRVAFHETRLSKYKALGEKIDDDPAERWAIFHWPPQAVGDAPYAAYVFDGRGMQPIDDCGSVAAPRNDT